jgi:bacterioferritin-associated ferredoxin
MVVCNCLAVRESTIREVIASGATTVEAVEAACGAGGDCGCCRDEIADLISASAVIAHSLGNAQHPQHERHAHGACADCPNAQRDNRTSRAA